MPPEMKMFPESSAAEVWFILRVTMDGAMTKLLVVRS